MAWIQKMTTPIFFTAFKGGGSAAHYAIPENALSNSTISGRCIFSAHARGVAHNSASASPGSAPRARNNFTISTRPGDLIVFFSDGIVDAVNAVGDMFGDERLTKLLESQHHPTARSTVDAILQAVSDFQSGTAHFDDETIVVLRVL